MVGALAAAHDAPELVVTEAVAAVEVADAVGAVVGRGQPGRAGLRCPSGAVAGSDRQRPELVEGEAPGREPADDLLDPVQLSVLVGVAGLLPGAGALKADLGFAQDLPQPFPADPHHALMVAAQVGGELAHAPVGERKPERFGSGGGRRDDERDIGVTDPAGTASRPLRVQRGQPSLVEGVDHVADGVLVRGDQPGDRRHRRARRRGENDRCPTDPDRVPASSAHDLGQPVPFLIGQSTCSDWFSHRPPHTEDEINNSAIVGPRTACRQPGERSWSPH